MPNRFIRASIVLLALGIIVMPFVSRPASHVDVVGRVYHRVDSVGGGSGTPVSGAVVSNDWDSTTATTNVHGEFRLRVRRVAADEWIKFTARSSGMAACHRRLGSLESTQVDIVLNDPGFDGCRPDQRTKD